jgi:hypothetical protein
MPDMGRTVNNLYGKNPYGYTLEIISNGLYQLEIVFNESDYDAIRKYRWCFDSGKGLVYTHDLTMDLPKQMGYITPRVYLRDYLVFLKGYWNNNRPTHSWFRDSVTDYCLDVNKLKPVAAFV